MFFSDEGKAGIKGGKDANKEAIWSKQNAGLTQREKRDLQERLQEEAKVRTALEVKAQLYDKLHKGQAADVDQRFLVNFDARHNESSDDEDYDDKSYETRNEEEEWVEYVDALGR